MANDHAGTGLDAPLPPRATHTAVLVAVPEVELVVARSRASLDPAASWGVPAHVTVVFPFLEPDALDASVVARLRAAVAEVATFECEFDGIGWFGEDVAWLRPSPQEPFRDLTVAVARAFPEHPPYGGAHDEIVPHLTFGRASAGSAMELREAAAALAPMLPVRRCRVAEAVLIAGTDELLSWRVVASLPLGQS